MKRASLANAAVPEELLSEWAAADGTLPAAFLLHPDVRGDGTEGDVRGTLEKKELGLEKRVSTKDFVKLAARVQRRGTSKLLVAAEASDSGGAPSADPPVEPLQPWLTPLNVLLSAPRWPAQDAAPAAFAQNLYVGSAEHASDVATLRRLGITAVLNLAPGACEDPVDLYADSGIEYAEVEAEDFEGYPLLELHLREAAEFFDAHAPAGKGGRVLVHCFAGVNRSAATAVAVLLLREHAFVGKLVERCFEARPFILSNVSFRLALLRLAESEGLLGQPPVQEVAVNVIKV